MTIRIMVSALKIETICKYLCINTCSLLFHVLLSIGLCSSILSAQEIEDPSQNINFAEHIAPIVYENCTPCHRSDGVAPFRISSYQDVRRRSRQISDVVASKYMPPWKPDAGYGPKVIGERRLTDEQIKQIQAWDETGAKPGDLSRAPEAPQFSSTWQLGQPDLIVSLGEDYLLPAEGSDVYRNFSIPLQLSKRKYVRALEFLPRSQLVIHHAVIMVDQTSGSRDRDALDPAPGFDGMGFGSSSVPDGQFVGWTPGQDPFVSFPGTAWKIEPGSDLVIELHMLPSGKVETVNPKIGFYFTDTPPERPTQVISLRQFEIDIAPGESNYMVEQEFVVPVDVEVLGVYPHAHLLGKELNVFSTFPDGSKNWLIRISDWDFNWQADYRFEVPMRIPSGSKIHMSYRYDNSSDNIRNPSTPPRRVKGGWKSTDEMAEATIQLMLQNEQGVHAIREAQAAYDVNAAGGLSLYAYNLGTYFDLQGVLEKAADMYSRAIREDPNFASALYRLGYVLERMGHFEAAQDRYTSAIAIRPEMTSPYLGLARIYFQKGFRTLAKWELEKVLEWEDYNFEARVSLARIFADQSKEGDAVQLLKLGLVYHSENPYYHMELGKLYYSRRELDQALEHLQFAYEKEVVQDRPLSQSDLHKLRSEALFSIGLVFEAKHELVQALEYYDRAIAEMAHHVNAHLASADLMLRMGNRIGAADRLKLFLEIPHVLRPSTEEIVAFGKGQEWNVLLYKAGVISR